MAKTRTNQQRSIDPAAQQMLIRAEELGLGTAFTRAEAMAACPIGIGSSAGICCKNCFMGPCRLTKEGQVGVCGATVETIAARNLARAVAAGSAAHSDHGRDVAFTLLAAAEGQAQGYEIRDVTKLHAVARKFGIPTDKRTKEEIAKDVANKAIAQFGQQNG
ncbi:MAG: cooS 1, partial [Anaerolineales bacterium]|nr:cooS 1 [Anaerolineales bacterium]